MGSPFNKPYFAGGLSGGDPGGVIFYNAQGMSTTDVPNFVYNSVTKYLGAQLITGNMAFAAHAPDAVVAGFTVDPNASNIQLTSVAAVTSDTVTAISAGDTFGKVLFLQNFNAFGGNTITIKNAANTRCNGDADLVLNPGDIALFLWQGTLWFQVL